MNATCAHLYYRAAEQATTTTTMTTVVPEDTAAPPKMSESREFFVNYKTTRWRCGGATMVSIGRYTKETVTGCPRQSNYGTYPASDIYVGINATETEEGLVWGRLLLVSQPWSGEQEKRNRLATIS